MDLSGETGLRLGEVVVVVVVGLILTASGLAGGPWRQFYSQCCS